MKYQITLISERYSQKVPVGLFEADTADKALKQAKKKYSNTFKDLLPDWQIVIKEVFS